MKLYPTSTEVLDLAVSLTVLSSIFIISLSGASITPEEDTQTSQLDSNSPTYQKEATLTTPNTTNTESSKSINSLEKNKKITNSKEHNNLQKDELLYTFGQLIASDFLQNSDNLKFTTPELETINKGISDTLTLGLPNIDAYSIGDKVSEYLENREQTIAQEKQTQIINQLRLNPDYKVMQENIYYKILNKFSKDTDPTLSEIENTYKTNDIENLNFTMDMVIYNIHNREVFSTLSSNPINPSFTNLIPEIASVLSEQPFAKTLKIYLPPNPSANETWSKELNIPPNTYVIIEIDIISVN